MFDTHVMHCERLTERREHVEKALQSMNISDYHLTTDEMDYSYSGFYEDNESKARDYAQVWLDQDPNRNYKYTKLAPASISLCWKWYNALRRFVDLSKNDYGLFLEDDFCFSSEMKIKREDIELIIKDSIPTLCNDVVFLGGAFSHSIITHRQAFPASESKISGFVLSGHPSTNTTSSLIIKKSAAERILEILCPFYLPIDWQFNYVFQELDLLVLHTFPYVCSQLSAKKDGFVSEVRR